MPPAGALHGQIPGRRQSRYTPLKSDTRAVNNRDFHHIAIRVTALAAGLGLAGLPPRRRGWQVRDTIEDAISGFIQVE